MPLPDALALPLPLHAVAKLLEVSHVAHRLNVGHPFVRRLIRSKQLKAIRFGHRWRIDEVDLEAFIDAHRVEARA